MQASFSSSSFADLLTSPFQDDPSTSVLPPEELDPFPEVSLHSQPPSPAPLPSFQETYSVRYSTPYKMEEEYISYHHAVPHPSHYEYPSHHPYATTPYYPPPPTCSASMGFETMAPHESYSLPPFQTTTAEMQVSTAMSPRHRRASLPLQRSESTSSSESPKLRLAGSAPSACSSAASSPGGSGEGPSAKGGPTPPSPSQLCAVCGDTAACQHYGVRTCEG